MYFHIRGSFFNNFCTSFLKRVHNSKKVVNIQGLFVLTVGYVDVTTFSLTKCYYIIEKVHLIAITLFISTFSFLLFLYIVSWRHKRDYLHASIDILFYTISCIINTTYLRYKKVPTTSPLFVVTPLKTSLSSSQ